MDAQNQPKDQHEEKYTSKQTNLGPVLKETWNLYIKNFFPFLGLFVLPVILTAIFQLVIFGAVGINAAATSAANGGSLLQNLNIWMLAGGVILAVVLGWLIQLLGINAILRGAYYADTQGKIPFGQTISDALKELGASSWLSIRIFLYTGAWIFMMLAVVMVLGIFGAAISGDGTALFSPTVQTYINYVASWTPLVMIVVAVFIIRRFCKVAFAFPILLSKKISNKEAMHESIELSRGMLGKIFWNYVLMSLLVGIVAVILNQLIAQIIGMVFPMPTDLASSLSYIQYMTVYVGIIPSLLVGTFSMIFGYSFMKKALMGKAEMAGGMQKTMEPPSQPTPPTSPMQTA